MEQHFDERNVAPPPPHIRAHQLRGVASEYRRAVIAHGIPWRPHGLFPPRDPLLHRLAADKLCHAFEKHLPGAASPYDPLPAATGGWATGDAAARRGLDLRLFYQEPPEQPETLPRRGEAAEGAPQLQQRYGRIRGAVRLGDGAAIGSGSYMSAHGGAIESVLDEATAELAKLEFVPMVSTRSITFQIIKPVPLHTSLAVSCHIREVRGIRCYVEGAITAAGGSRGEEGGKEEEGEATVYATATALLVDITDWI